MWAGNLSANNNNQATPKVGAPDVGRYAAKKYMSIKRRTSDYDYYRS
jgi:hypothetical protein